MSQHLKAHCKIFRVMRDIWFATRVFFVRGLHFEKVSFFGLPFSDVLTSQLLNLATASDKSASISNSKGGTNN